jgi:hypothetical protein
MTTQTKNVVTTTKKITSGAILAKKPVQKKESVIKTDYKTDVLKVNKDTKVYLKTFKGSRDLLLSGKSDQATEMNDTFVKILNETKTNGKLYAWFMQSSKRSADYKFKNKAGKEIHVKYDNMYNTISVLNSLNKIVKDKGLCISLSLFV